MKTLQLSITAICCISLVIILPHAFADTKESVPSASETQFQLKVNQTASLESNNIKVKFLNVIEDSRCPDGVTCIWEGQVKIIVNIIKNDSSLGNFVLTSRAGQPDMAIQTFDGHSIQVVNVEPYPTNGKKISLSDYVATFIMPNSSILSPLKQFKSGISAKDVKCKDNFQLVIKNSDGSPACVKPEHLARLAQYGWTIPNLKIIGDYDITNNDGLSESNCGQFHTIPENKSDSNETPVLILQQNSIGCAKITFTVLSLFNNTNDCIGCNSQIVKIGEMLSIGKYNFSRHGNLLSGSTGTNYAHSFQITAVPKTVDLANFPVGSNFTVIFIIKPLPNATGFYDYSIVKPACNAYPLAVGYSPDQVNASDFSEDLSFMQNHPCPYGPYGYSPVQVSGINYVQMKLN